MSFFKKKGGGKGKGPGGKPAFRARTFPRQRPVRRAQLISPFGVGAITDFRNDEALMCAGLDEWFSSAPPTSDLVVNEERLQRRLHCSHFVKPPDYSDSEGGSRLKIPYVRFPLWHYCHRCFRMKKASMYGGQPSCDHCKAGSVGRRMIPVRVVAVCEEGHAEDFPFRKWIGCKCESDDAAQLYFKAGRSAASLAGIKIECGSCGVKPRSLAGAFDETALTQQDAQCSCSQPWLGRYPGPMTCRADLQTVQRGGSNVYFPLVVSSIYIPPDKVSEPDDIRAILDHQGYWETISSELEDGKVSAMACKFIAKPRGVDPEILRKAAQARIDALSAPVVETVSEEEYRRQEYRVLREGLGDPRNDLYCEIVPGSEYGWLSDYVTRVGLVRKLRETRVNVGFSRLKPKSDRGERGVQSLAAGDVNWLPAVEVRGEGIFIEFDGQRLADWASRPKSSGRVAALVTEYNKRRQQRDIDVRHVDARFIAIHSLAHALIKELTFTCGYGSASLRERLYYSVDAQKESMNGILIYTASGDSEGTLGGLVNQADADRLPGLFASALRRAQWCSNDPVCIESPGGGLDVANMAACHGCVLLPETSCEEGNRLLDRALLIGTIDEPSIGWFSDAQPLR